MSNFDFLKDEYPELAKLAYLAECYYENDPVSSLAKMRRCENVTTDVLLRICEALDCQLEDIVERVPSEEK